jgi:hypothetical protein
MGRRISMKTPAFVLIAGAALLSFLGGCTSMTSDELLSSMEVIDVETKWVEKYYQAWPPRLIVVPQISFRVKNVSERSLDYVNFNAIFKFKGDLNNFGDAFLAAIRGESVPPGGTSEVIVLKSNFGVEGKNLENIRENPEWKPTETKLFAISKGSQPVLLGVYDVSREIDFKEPDAPEIKKDGER